MPVSKERVEAIFTEISQYKIELASDPTTLGAKYLQDLIATCRNYTNHVARLMNEVYREKMGVDFELRRKETAFNIASDELLANDTRVRNLPNITDRQAQINLLLRDEHREIENLRNDIRELEHLDKLIRMVHRELKDTMSEIKLQRSLIRDEIETGRFYGDERPSAREHAFMAGGASRIEDIDEEEISRMLSGEKPIPSEEGESASPAAEEVSTDSESTSSAAEAPSDEVSAPVSAPTIVSQAAEPAKPATEEEEVLAFLNGKSAQPSTLQVQSSSDPDFSEIFDQL